MLKPLLITLALLVPGCAEPGAPDDGAPPGDSIRVTSLIPLTDLGSRSYLGYAGGLYLDGSNTMPEAHAAEGRRRAALVVPRDVNGAPDAQGRIVLLSVSMSNGSQEYCAVSAYTECETWSFVGQARADASVNHGAVTLINGARGGQETNRWTAPTSPEYDRVRDQGLEPLGLSERQVQVAWVKMANVRPTRSLPDAQADAYQLQAGIGDVLRALTVRYPNLQMVFLTSRIYAGFASTAQNPEPYAYETGFANKWVIEDQIRQTLLGQRAQDSRAGNVDYRTGAVPWVAWGPYLWAGDQQSPRADGLFWQREDFQSDGTHPSTSGERKVAAQLLDFFRQSQFTKCWFLAAQVCP